MGERAATSHRPPRALLRSLCFSTQACRLRIKLICRKPLLTICTYQPDS